MEAYEFSIGQVERKDNGGVPVSELAGRREVIAKCGYPRRNGRL